MKKLLPILLAIIIFFSSFVMQVNKANAAVGAAAGAVGAAAGAAAGPWIIAGLLVAGGAAVVVGVSDEDIRNKAMSIWNRTSDGFKNGFNTAVDVTGEAWKGTVNLTQDMINELSGFAGEVGDWLYNLLRGHEANGIEFDQNYEINPGCLRCTTKWISASNGGDLLINGIRFGSLYTYRAHSNGIPIIRGVDQDGVIGGGSVDFSHSYDRYKHGNIWDEQASITDFINLLGSIGIKVSVVASLDQATQTVSADVLAGNFVGALSGVNEVAIPLDAWLAEAQTSTGQKVNINTATGVMTLPDGTIYEGDIKFPWTVPKGETGTFPDVTVGNPSVPVDKVFPKNPTTTNPPTDGGILQGLWDWLKGILQKILDAIKALSALIGLTALIDLVKKGFDDLMKKWDDARAAPKKKVDFSKLAVAAGAFTNIFPFSIPWDFGRTISVLNVDPKAPVLKVDVKEKAEIAGKSIPINYRFDLNLSSFDAVAAVGRWALILIFDITIILALRRLTPD